MALAHHWNGGLVQRHSGHFDLGAILHGADQFGREVAAIGGAASALSAKDPVLGNFQLYRRQVDDLPGFFLLYLGAACQRGVADIATLEAAGTLSGDEPVPFLG